MEFYCYSPFVVMTADQFVGRDDGLLEQQYNTIQTLLTLPKIRLKITRRVRVQGNHLDYSRDLLYDKRMSFVQI